MHIKTPQAHRGAPGKDEGNSLHSVRGSGHCYSLSAHYPNNEIVYHKENQSVNTRARRLSTNSPLLVFS